MAIFERRIIFVMALKLMYITNSERVAEIADRCGVDRVWIDLEYKGKEDRQKGMNTVKSKHSTEDIDRVKKVLSFAQLMVRVNPLSEESKAEVDDVIARGADLVMLPMYKSVAEAKRFVELVDGRAKVMLLAETAEAVESIGEVVKIPGIDEIHIGLNDLHIAYGMDFMFELLANGCVEKICKTIAKTNIKYGFGGLARLNEGTLPASAVIAEHYRLGSSMAILSRSFCNTSDANINLEETERLFETGIAEIRNFEKLLEQEDKDFFVDNTRNVQKKVNEIVEQIKIKRACGI